MIDRGKHNVLGIRVSAVDYDSAVAQICAAAVARQPLRVTALAVHGVMTGVLDKAHRYRLNQFDLICPDGQPVRWALNWLHGTQLQDRVYGPDLMLKLCAAAEERELSVFLLGADKAMLHRLRESLVSRYPRLKIAGMRPSLFRQLTTDERSDMVNEVRASGADVMFVGLGCPRQEIFVYECCDDFHVPCLAVGAAFAFHAGVTKQAPSWMQRAGLEWLFRLGQEPRRLWRRYVLLNPAYLALLLLQRSKIRVLDDTDTQKPTFEHGYG